MNTIPNNNIPFALVGTHKMETVAKHIGGLAKTMDKPGMQHHSGQIEIDRHFKDGRWHYRLTSDFEFSVPVSAADPAPINLAVTTASKLPKVK